MLNKITLAVLFAGFSAQIIKLIIFWFKEGKLTWHDLIVTGGMPSSHSAFAVSLATIIFLVEGRSTAFAISMVFAILVLRDSFGVRRSVGTEGKQIERLFKIHKIKSDFHYSIGHTPLQVFMGALLGLVVSISVYYLL